MPILDEDAPQLVRWALVFAVASVAIGLINSIREFPTASATVHPGALVAASIVMTALWAGLLYLVAKRRNWARILFAVVAFLAVPGALVSVLALPSTDRITAAVAFAQHGANVCAAILLLLPPSSLWFNARRERAA